MDWDAHSDGSPLWGLHKFVTLIPKGGVVESRRHYVPEAVFGPILSTASHGAWQKVGHREFPIHLVSLVQGAPDNATAKGVELATDIISLRVELNEAGTELHGFFQDEVKDLEGTVVFTTVGTYHATRIRAESEMTTDDKPGANAD
jgi:hypothetical protein